ncbi:MAG: CDP-glycerol glycerophosphotransferase family protein [Coprobacillus cateniformis]
MSSDYLISPSEFMTTIYKQAFKLDGIYQGNIIQEGQPRNDNLFNTNRNDIINKLISYGVNVDPNKKIIMYAPTWKGGDYGNPDIGLEEYFNFIDTLESNINTDEYQVLVKPHQIVYKHIKNNKNITSQFIPAIIDTNEILSVVDILVSDYSSIYFDFLATGRPILFYIPDLEEYQKYRGLYHSIDTLPGPKTKIMADIPKWINNLESVIETYKSIYHEQKTSCCQYDDGNVCGRLLDILLENNKSPYHIISDMVTEKKK